MEGREGEIREGRGLNGPGPKVRVYEREPLVSENQGWVKNGFGRGIQREQEKESKKEGPPAPKICCQVVLHQLNHIHQ